MTDRYPWNINKSFRTELSRPDAIRRHAYALRVLASSSENNSNHTFARAARARSYRLRASAELAEKES